MKKVVNEFNIDKFRVTVKEDKKERRSVTISTSKWDTARKKLQIDSDNNLRIDNLRYGMSVPITLLPQILHELGIGQAIWEELNKYYKEKKTSI